MRIISILNQKGGCGKTTTAINLAGELARRGLRTLLVDMDPQSHCAAGLAVPEDGIDLDIGDAMIAGDGELDTQRLLWHVSRNLDLIPSRMKLAGIESARGPLAEHEDKDRRLALALNRFADHYDVCIIDCSPAIGLLTFNALTAANDVIVPVETGYFALQGATKQVTTIKTLAKRLDAAPGFWILPTIHEESSTLASDVLEELKRRFAKRVAPVVIRRDVTLKEAASFGQPVCEYAAMSAAALDHAMLADWAIAALGLAPGVPARAPEQRAAALADAHAPDAAANAAALLQSRTAELADRVRRMTRRDDAALDPAPAAASPHLPRAIEPSIPRNPLVLDIEPAGPRASSNSAQNLPGVLFTSQGVLFTQPLELGATIAVAGTFNNWSPTRHMLRPNPALGVHELCVPIAPGRHEYRLIIDGTWSLDTRNNDTCPSSLGGLNSVIFVPKPAEPAPAHFAEHKPVRESLVAPVAVE